jgi:dolichyl-phosphate beta-glucosyltransferase
MSRKNRHPLSMEQFYVDPTVQNKEGSCARFPYENIYAPPTLSLSIVIPAYNEEKRLPKMLSETIPYLQARTRTDPSFTFELIIVDDGSRDGTAALVLAYSAKYGHDCVRLMKLAQNMGKGAAVQQGVLHSRGRLVLFADADGASDFTCYDKVEKALHAATKAGLGVAIGSRAHLEEASRAQRSGLRTLLMHGFHALVAGVSGLTHIKDTQCGFKLFTRAAALAIFANQRIQRWCFDVELLFIAERLRIPVAEVAINWVEVDGSKVEIMDASLTMGRDLCIIRACYSLGLWTIDDPHSPAIKAVLPIKFDRKFRDITID